MRDGGFHKRGHYVALKIRSLLVSLTKQPSEYDEIASKIEYWIEYVLREQFTTVDELVEGVSQVAWDGSILFANVARFLKEFSDAPHRSEQARSFVDKLCEYVLRWFAIASAGDLPMNPFNHSFSVASGGGSGFLGAASLVGHLIEWGLLCHELVRLHLVKPLVAHHYTDGVDDGRYIRNMAIYRLFVAARNTLLQGLLEPDDVQACFKTLGAKVSLQGVTGPNAAKELREFHAAWLKCKEEEQRGAGETEVCKREEEEDTVAAEVPAEVETPVAFVSQNLPAATIDINIPSSTFQGIKSPYTLHGVDSSSGTFVDVPTTAVSSPAFSISTVSDLTPTELSEGIEHSGEQVTTRHNTFYFEDGNVEITCGDTVFRVHSTVVSFSSSKLRDILSPSTLLDAPMPGGCPRIVFTDSAEDFAILLQMIYTPGFPAGHEIQNFSVFSSLLRMTTKYGFSNIRDQLVKNLKGAYPTEWEAYQTAGVLGEDMFGSPAPHPNAVLNLFMTQDVGFAIPFAAYRASLGGFSTLVSGETSTVLPRHTLASTIHGRGEIQRVMTQAANTIAYKECLLSACPYKACALNAGIKSMEQRMEALSRVHDAMIGERKGGVLSTPSLGGLACTKCTKEVEESHATWRKTCWELLPAIFLVAKQWDEV